MNPKKIYVSQVDEEDCGVAALSMILRNYGSKFSLSKLRKFTKTTNNGTTALGLKKAAEHFGLNVYPIKTDISILKDKDLIYPFIVHVIKNNEIEHYYVVLEAKEKYVLVADPAPDVQVTKMTYDIFMKEWDGVALFFSPKKDYKQQVENHKDSLFKYTPIILKHKKLLTAIFLSAVIVTLISVLGSYFLQSLIDTYIPRHLVNTLSIISLGLIFAYLVQSIFWFLQNFLVSLLGQKLSIDIILKYINHVLNLPIEFFSTHKMGDIISRFNDANKITDALASSIISIGLDFTVVIIMGVILIIQNINLFLITLLTVPLYIIVIWTFHKPFEKLNKKQMESGAMLESSIIEDLHGIETIKTLTNENKSYLKISSNFTDYLTKSLKYTKIDKIQQSLKLLIQFLLSVIILWVGSKLVIKNNLTVGQLITFNALLTYFINPLQNIVNLQPKLQSAKVANNRLNEIYLVGSEFQKERPLKEKSILQGPIILDHVHYKYGYGEDILKDINLTINPKDKLTIVGMSGSGKSTLVKLLVDFFDPTKGRILINQHNISEIDKITLRKQIVYVPQSPYVFSGTILDNLKMGNRPNINFDDIRNACKIAQIKDDIEAMALQYDTKLGENGDVLSGGQKQRLTIARALLSPAEVLIFDESTSGLDAITEAQLIDDLMQLNKTIIFIAHRLTIAKKTNNIVVLDHGQIVERGTHQELLNNHENYYQLLNSI